MSSFAAPDLAAAAGFDPWALLSTLHAGDPSEIEGLAAAFYRAGGDASHAQAPVSRSATDAPYGTGAIGWYTVGRAGTFTRHTSPSTLGKVAPRTTVVGDAATSADGHSVFLGVTNEDTASSAIVRVSEAGAARTPSSSPADRRPNDANYLGCNEHLRTLPSSAPASGG